MSNEAETCPTCDGQGEIYITENPPHEDAKAHPCPDCIVFVCLYTHKHGIDVGVYRTHEAALDAAYCLALERVAETWEDDDRAKFNDLPDRQAALALFHEVELEWNYSEHLEILERPLG